MAILMTRAELEQYEKDLVKFDEDGVLNPQAARNKADKKRAKKEDSLRNSVSTSLKEISTVVRSANNSAHLRGE